jgi:hypothetical protein
VLRALTVEEVACETGRSCTFTLKFTHHIYQTPNAGIELNAPSMHPQSPTLPNLVNIQYVIVRVSAPAPCPGNPGI